MLARQLFGLLQALGAGRADGDNLRSQRGGAVHLDLGRVARHHDDRLHAQGARRVGDSLRVIAAGIRDNPALRVLVLLNDAILL